MGLEKKKLDLLCDLPFHYFVTFKNSVINCISSYMIMQRLCAIYTAAYISARLLELINSFLFSTFFTKQDLLALMSQFTRSTA